MELLLRPILPFLLPALLVPWPIYLLWKTLRVIDEPDLKSQIKTVVMILSTYVLVNLPYSIVLIIDYAMFWAEVNNERIVPVVDLRNVSILTDY